MDHMIRKNQDEYTAEEALHQKRGKQIRQDNTLPGVLIWSADILLGVLIRTADLLTYF